MQQLQSLPLVNLIVNWLQKSLIVALMRLSSYSSHCAKRVAEGHLRAEILNMQRGTQDALILDLSA